MAQRKGRRKGEEREERVKRGMKMGRGKIIRHWKIETVTVLLIVRRDTYIQ